MQVALLQGEIMCEYNNNNQVSTTPSGLAVEQQIQGDDKMKVYQQVTIPFVSTKTDEQQSEGGENMISESESLLISVSCVVDELHDDLKHGVSEPWYIKQQLDKLNYYFGLYKTAVFEENTDPSKGIQLVRDE